MLKYSIITDNERKELAKIEQRRIREEERKIRIFNPRIRLIGVDEKSLQNQINDKKRIQENVNKVNSKFIEYLRNADKIALCLAEKEKKERCKIEQEINWFRQNCQQREYRREYDLNDPEYIKKQLPARLSDNDARLGPSSAQIFTGEDLMIEQRYQAQKQQNKACLEQQMIEKYQAEKAHQIAENFYRETILARDRRALELNEMERKCRRNLAIAIQKFNNALDVERKNNYSKQQKQILEDNLAEMANAVTSDLLTEDPDVAQSNLGVGRIIPYAYKGMSPEERATYRQGQLTQIKEQKVKGEMEKKMEKQFYDYFNEAHKIVSFMDHNVRDAKKELDKKIAQENMEMAVKQKQYKEFLNAYRLTNVPNEKYFGKFGQSSR